MKAGAIVVLVVLSFLGFLILMSITVVPAGNVGVQDTFGNVSNDAIPPGIHMVNPLSKVIKLSVKTIEIKEVVDVPSKEGLNISLEVSQLVKLDSASAVSIYKTVGREYIPIVVKPQLRSAIREVTATYEAKALYSTQRDKIASEINALFKTLTEGRGVITEQTLLRKIQLPDVVAKAIQEKLKREQEAQQMQFVLQKEQQEAERKRIEAQGIADFQKIVTAGISEPLLYWKGIEATEKLAVSPNAKIIIIGNPKTGLPLVFSGEAGMTMSAEKK